MVKQLLLPAFKASYISKARVIHLTKQFVSELAQYNIRINCIVPGLFWSELTHKLLTTKGEEIKSNIPLNIIDETSDFDSAIQYFALN